MEVLMKQARDVDLSFVAPPSKSYTHRALIAASLAEGESVIAHPLISEDTGRTRAALEQLGVLMTGTTGAVAITGTGGHLDCNGRCEIDAGNSGTTLRLLASLAPLSKNPVTLTGSPRMQERPLGPLGRALEMLGADVQYLAADGFPPVRIGGNLRGGLVTVDARMSSQFVSSILLASPYADKEVTILLPGPVSSRSYIEVTLAVMVEFGVPVTRDGFRTFCIPNDHGYRGRKYTVEGDYSSASYFFAIAAICGGTVTVSNVNPCTVQGDRAFLDALGEMGCTVHTGRDSVTVESDGNPSGIEIDMSSSPDTVQTLCMVAAVAEGKSCITGISHLRYKESDRIKTTAELLGLLGGNVEIGEDALVITPAPLHGGRIPTYEDHRIAMSFAVLGLRVEGIVIRDAECTEKSFPGFWKALEGAGLCHG